MHTHINIHHMIYTASSILLVLFCLSFTESRATDRESEDVFLNSSGGAYFVADDVHGGSGHGMPGVGALDSLQLENMYYLMPSDQQGAAMHQADVHGGHGFSPEHENIQQELTNEEKGLIV